MLKKKIDHQGRNTYGSIKHCVDIQARGRNNNDNNNNNNNVNNICRTQSPSIGKKAQLKFKCAEYTYDLPK